jgi:hypothetical protein
MAENELLEEIPNHIASSLKAIEESKRINHLIKNKERELEKAQGELEFNEKDTSLHKAYLDKKLNAETRKSNQISSLDLSCEREITKLEAEKKELYQKIEGKTQRIQDEIKALQNNLETYVSKLEGQINLIDSLKESVHKKFDDRKKKVETEEDSHIAFFQSEIDRITSKKSTPKIRGLESDIINLWKDLMVVDKVAYGSVSRLPDKPYLEEIAEEVEKQRQEAEEKEKERKAAEAAPKSRLYIFSTTESQPSYPTIISDTKKKREAKKPPPS